MVSPGLSTSEGGIGRSARLELELESVPRHAWRLVAGSGSLGAHREVVRVQGREFDWRVELEGASGKAQRGG